jgi:glycosyltransferase involved in cell wall biosynthesis
MKKFSIVTVVLNGEFFIRRAIESVLAQNYPNFEHIIIDGASKDDTMKIVKEYPHLKWVSEPDNGSVFAVNKGLALMTGDVFGWLNSDEDYLPGAFHKVAAYLEQHPEWDVIYGGSEWVDKDGRRLGYRRSRPFNLKRQILGFNNPGPPSAVFTRCTALDGIGRRVDERWKDAYDHDLWIRLALKYRIQNIPDNLSRFALHQGSGVSSAPERSMREAILIRQFYGGEDTWVDRLIWVNYYKLYLFLYRILKWNRMLEKSSVILKRS